MQIVSLGKYKKNITNLLSAVGAHKVVSVKYMLSSEKVREICQMLVHNSIREHNPLPLQE